MDIKALIFNSCYTLNYPRTGNWFIPPNFNKIVNVNKTKVFNYILMLKAISKAKKCINNRAIYTEEEEYKFFMDFYNIVAREPIGISLSKEQIMDIAEDLVYNDEKFMFPNEVFEIIPRLSQRYKLGVVANKGPSIERIFKKVGLKDYFSTFLIGSSSSLFLEAIKELKVIPAETAFIDRKEENLEITKKFGMRGILFLNKGIEGKCVVRNLKELESLLKNQL